MTDNRTRPEYDLTCQDCGKAHILDTSLPSEIWNQIAKPEDVLCALCIDARLVKTGLTCDVAEFYFSGQALKSRLYGGASNFEAALRQRAEAAEERAGLFEDLADGRQALMADIAAERDALLALAAADAAGKRRET